MGDEEKRAIAMATLLGLGIGAVYLLKDELGIYPGDIVDESKNMVKSEKNMTGGTEENMPDLAATTQNNLVESKKAEKSDSLPGKEVHGLTWDYFRRWLGNSVPVMDMMYIYPLLPEDFKNMWRRGLYNHGVETRPDKLFAYYDGFYLSQRGYKNLGRQFNLYAYRRGSFESFFEEYRKVIREILD